MHIVSSHLQANPYVLVASGCHQSPKAWTEKLDSASLDPQVPRGLGTRSSVKHESLLRPQVQAAGWTALVWVPRVPQ